MITKTTTSSSLVKTLPHDKTLILSAESGLLSIKDAVIDVAVINTFKDLVDVYSMLAKGDCDYENVYIDSLTEIGEILFNELKPDYTKSQTFALYGDYAEKITKLLKAFRDLTDYNIYFTALDKTVESGVVSTVTIDLIQKSLSKKIPALFDIVFHYQKLQKEDGTIVRALCSDSIDVEFTKDRSGFLSKYESPDLTIVHNKIFGKK